jgi:hypothetical protein
VFRREGSTGRTAGLAIGVVLALAACSSAPADDPETTAQRFLRALAVNELDKACLTMADGVPFGVQDLPECNNFLGAVAAEPDNQVAKYAHAKVRSAAVQDDPARVTKADISNVANLMLGCHCSASTAGGMYQSSAKPYVDGPALRRHSLVRPRATVRPVVPVTNGPSSSIRSTPGSSRMWLRMSDQ